MEELALQCPECGSWAPVDEFAPLSDQEFEEVFEEDSEITVATCPNCGGLVPLMFG